MALAGFQGFDSAYTSSSADPDDAQCAAGDGMRVGLNVQRILKAIRQAVILGLEFIHLDQPLRRLRRGGQEAQDKRAELQQHMGRMYSQFVQPGDLCFDIGAHLGSRVEVFLSLGATAVAVEPQPSCVRHLRARYMLHPRVVVLACGLDRQMGRQQLILSDTHSVLASMSKEFTTLYHERSPDRSWGKTITVRVTTLDRLIERYGLPAFCKIDAESYDDQILHGLSQPIKALSFEYHLVRMQCALNCLARLQQLGAYEFNYSAGESMAFALPGWVSAREMDEKLRSIPDQVPIYGDVYARLLASSGETVTRL